MVPHEFLSLILLAVKGKIYCAQWVGIQIALVQISTGNAGDLPWKD